MSGGTLRRALLAGLGLGMTAGVVETAVISLQLGSVRDIGNLFLVDAAVWGLVGLAVAFLAFLSGAGSRDEEPVREAIAVPRVILALIILAAGIQINSRHLPSVLHWKSLAFNLGLVIAAAMGWWASMRFAKSPSAVGIFRGFSRAWFALVIAIIVIGVGAKVLSSSGRDVVFSRFAGRAPAESSGETAAPRVMLLGLDSATWRILTPLVESGRMPNLAGLMRQGRWGVLKSYETSPSPVVWTSIMTGKAPGEHGITGWNVATAANRRAKSVWGIAEEHGHRSAVVNVPGTFPVLGDCEVMLSGFPLPTATYSNRGCFLTTREGRAGSVLPTERLSLDLEDLDAGEEWRTQIRLRDLPVSVPSGETGPALLLNRVAPRVLMRMQKALVPVEFGTLDLIVRKDAASGALKVGGSGSEPLFHLTRGDWSDWLIADINGKRHSFKVHCLNTEQDELSLYITPFYPYPDAGLARPADWLEERMVTPYVAEGVGWQIFLEPRLLETLHEHLTDVAASRVNAGLAILEQQEPDLFVYIVTLTDRIQHPMLKFLLPSEYEKLAGEVGGNYERLKPTPEMVEQFGDVIRDTYTRADEWIGQFLAYADTSTTVIIVSDHGATAGRHAVSPTAGIHHPDGIYVIAQVGENHSDIPLSTTRGPDLVLEDVTPTTLALLGLPPAHDMVGSYADFAPALAEADLELVETYETETGGQGQKEVWGKSVEEQLRSLGYIQ
jgi:hypothetical protein